MNADLVEQQDRQKVRIGSIGKNKEDDASENDGMEGDMSEELNNAKNVVMYTS